MKFMLMMHAPKAGWTEAGIGTWPVEDLMYHIRFMKDFAKELAESGALPARRAMHLLNIGASARSLDVRVGEKGDESLGDLMADDRVPRPERTAHLNLLREKVREEVKGLPTREQEILQLRFGLGSDRPRTLEEVAKVFQVSR
jgi:RNA polymerase primary sigma factor